jgi:pilus assembly protein CpaF
VSLLKRIERKQDQAPEQQPSKLQDLRVKRTAPTSGNSRDAYVDLKTRIQQRLISEMDPSTDVTRTNEVRATIQELFETMLTEEQIVLTRSEKAKLFDQIVAEILGYGPIEQFLKSGEVGEIMVNGPKHIFVEHGGKLVRANVEFEDNDHVMRIIDRIVAPLGRRIDESSPTVDARLPDGSRVNAVIPPIALNGPHPHHPCFLQKPSHHG